MNDSSLYPNIVEFLAQTDPFDKLPAPVLQALAQQIEISYWGQGESIPADKLVATGLYIVRMGAIEQRNPDGTLRARLGNNDLFGFSQIDRIGRAEYQAIALENSLLYLIPKQVLQQVIAEHSMIADYFASAEVVRLATTVNLADDGFYLKPVSCVLNPVIAKVSPQATIQQAAQAMITSHRSSVLVMEEQELVGIITDRDMTRRVVANACDTQQPVSSIMTTQPYTINYQEPIIRAVELMMENNIRSLPVLKEGIVKGVLTATSLVNKSSAQAVYLISRVYQQTTLEQLKGLQIERQSVFESLVNNHVHPTSIQLVMSLIADAFNKRLLQLAEQKLGSAPIAYCWLVAGSHARNEMHYLSDQDSALLLASEPDSQQQNYFRQLAEFVCYGLAECGYHLCPGHMMATNPKWCLSLNQWQQQYQQWLINPQTEALLNISVFFDLRLLHGPVRLFTKLQRSILAAIKGHHRLLAMMVANSLRIQPPLGFFRQFVLAKDGENRNILNIKQQAINLIVELARIYALAAHNLTPSTEIRLLAAVEKKIISDETRKELLEALYFLNQVRFNHQLIALKSGKEVSNNIAPDLLTQFERNHLKDAFRIITRTQESARLLFNAKGVMM